MFSRFLLGLIVALALISYARLVVAKCEALNDSLQGDSDRISRGIAENPDITLDTEIEVSNNGNQFRLPIGFLYPRPWILPITCHIYGGCNPSDATLQIRFTGFEFWMPDGSFPVDTSTVLELKRCENDRNERDFLVRVDNLWTSKSGSEKLDSVRSIILSLQILRGKVSHVKYEKIVPERPDGLIEYVRVGVKLTPWGERNFLFKSDEILLEIDCTPDSPAKVCHGYFWKDSSDLYFRIVLPYEHLDQWKSVIKKANAKLLEWYQG